jgi:hypothetical protein
MRVTLDHNCIIGVENATAVGEQVRRIAANPTYECFVVNIGASEMRQHGVRPDNYAAFEALLQKTGLAHLPRMHPLAILDVTFFDKCVLAGGEDVRGVGQIQDALFGDAEPVNIGATGMNSAEGAKLLNRLCDVHGMYCHIRNGNDVFLTTDGNFMKQTKLPKLLALGAGRICKPEEL